MRTKSESDWYIVRKPVAVAQVSDNGIEKIIEKEVEVKVKKKRGRPFSKKTEFGIDSASE